MAETKSYRRLRRELTILCKTCVRVTANAGGVCTKCLKGEPAPGLMQVRKRLTSQVRRKKYSPEIVATVIETHRKLKLARATRLVASVAEKCGLKPYTVQHILTYYRSTVVNDR